jgi:hypothetical protein
MLLFGYFRCIGGLLPRGREQQLFDVLDALDAVEKLHPSPHNAAVDFLDPKMW